MGRETRIQYEGATYHVFNRGSRHQATFTDARDRDAFYGLLGSAADKHKVEIHAFCLMRNHYHLLLRTPEGNLAKAMQHLIGSYTRCFNRRHGYDGPLFRGRYQAVHVEGDAQFLAVSRYIHRNPIEAGLATDPGDYPHSSYPAFVGNRVPPDWLDTRFTLGFFSHRIGDFARHVAENSGAGTFALPAA